MSRSERIFNHFSNLNKPIAEIEQYIERIRTELLAISQDEYNHYLEGITPKIPPQANGNFIPEVCIVYENGEISPEEEELRSLLEIHRKKIRKARLEMRLLQMKIGKEVLRKIKKSPSEKTHLHGKYASILEAIVNEIYRPSLTIYEQDNLYYVEKSLLENLGSMEENEQTWAEFLQPKLPAILANARGVGRVNKDNSLLGTCFLVNQSNNIVLTNEHVATNNKFCIRQEDGTGKLNFTDGSVDFNALSDSQQNSQNKIAQVPFIAAPSCFDYSLMKLADSVQLKNGSLKNEEFVIEKREEQQTTPKLLKLRSEPMTDNELKGRLVYVIGHPGNDNYAKAEDVTSVFEDMLENKRIMPGKIDSQSELLDLPVLRHDCSTLPGCSGGYLVDAQEECIIGIHMRGDAKAGYNYAIPSWELAKHIQKNDNIKHFFEFC